MLSKLRCKNHGQKLNHKLFKINDTNEYYATEYMPNAITIVWKKHAAKPLAINSLHIKFIWKIESSGPVAPFSNFCKILCDHKNLPL